MTVRVVINGFGRIGRTILRLLATTRAGADVQVVAVNDIAPLETCAYLFEFDSVFGPFPGTVAITSDALVVNGEAIPFTCERRPQDLDFEGVDLLLECTGRSDGVGGAETVLRAGAAAVLISGPSDAAEATIVLGANDASFCGQRVVSNASCTTNALVPLLKLLDGTFGVESAHMTTVHCYTGSQPTIDAPRDDPARSRAAAMSMVPTGTSAGRLLEAVLPELTGRITVRAVRVPTPSVSAVDLIVRLRDRRDFDARFRDAVAAQPLLGWTDRPLVSTDLRGRPESLVLAGPETMHGPDLTRLFGWYDNEWGFSNRMIDMALRMGAAMRERTPDVA